MKELSNEEAIDVLDVWSALEVLSPQTFRKPENLIYGENKTIINLNQIYLPWEIEKSKPQTQIFYQVILGTINFSAAIENIIIKYCHNDTIIEKYSDLEEAIIAVAVLDSKGFFTSTAISSFAWGINKALEGDLKSLSMWNGFERGIIKDFEKILEKKDEEGNDLPIDKNTLDVAYDYLVDTLRIPKKVSIKRQFAVRAIEIGQKEDAPPQPLLMNSFYLQNLEDAKLLIKQQSKNLPNNYIPNNLQKYLGMKVPAKRHDILRNDKELENIVAPENIFPARWPSKGKHPLVLLQQAAVNLALSELKDEGIFAINGPPGTGKTTLLKDIIASVITKRAEALLKFNDPENAFPETGAKINSGSGWLKLYKVHESLKGFEMLIASSNNKAVENVTLEFPNVDSIATDLHDLKYFACTATELLGTDSWGLISAALGNSANKNRFRQKFWNHDDFGLAAYLAQADGVEQFVDVRQNMTGKVIETRKPKVILENDPPKNRHEALTRWNEAKQNFIIALDNSKAKLDELENIRQDILQFQNLAHHFGINEKITLEELISNHNAIKPNFIKRIFNSSVAIKWKEKFVLLRECEKLKKKIALFSKEFKQHVINKDFFSKNHDEKNLTSPWVNNVAQLLRDEAFCASLKLSKAFIDAAAKPLRNNIGILMQNFNKPINPRSKKKDDIASKFNALSQASAEDLWTSLFLIVPSLSTTFASVDKMFRYLPQSYLGWLIIDEAGQALPQAGVGAIIKTKRVIATGDPLQIEPITMLPAALTESICAEFGVDANRFNPPKASVQTLADEASYYYTEFATKHGSRNVGFPLLVHRRCHEPMFSISNVIAYERLMVPAKKMKPSLIRTCLGPSVWFHVSGVANDKWCEEEGEKAIDLLNKLKRNSIFPDLYIITPYKIVANYLRQMIKDTKVMEDWGGILPQLWISSRVGTIHTAQGREADSVILVLGAPMQEQLGSRLWAGLTPNILNVAITRAKENLYVIGNKNLWKDVGVFKELHDRINHK